jgi:hypothetical protein
MFAETDLWADAELSRVTGFLDDNWRDTHRQIRLSEAQKISDAAKRESTKQAIELAYENWTSYLATARMMIQNEASRRQKFFAGALADTRDFISDPAQLSVGLEKQVQEDWTPELTRRARFLKRLDSLREERLSALLDKNDRVAGLIPGIFVKDHPTSELSGKP